MDGTVERARSNCLECQRELPIRREKVAVKSAVFEVSLIEVPPFGLPIYEGGVIR